MISKNFFASELVFDNGTKDLKYLIGKEIVNIGFPKESKDLEGGLCIDYKNGKNEDGSDNITRMVLGFTELGMWIYWHGTIGQKEKQ